jgi:hypothetical protein
MPGIRVRPIHIANETTVAADIEAGASGAMPDIVAALTEPLTAGERSPTRDAAAPPRVAFAGDYEAVNRFFYRRGWTDGLPIVPPTEKAVAGMLEGTDLPPDHVVARVIPRLGKATVEKIAVNAVMAGALPTHMPVLLAAVRALMNPKARFDTFEVSTGSWAPFFALNGPVRNDILVNSGSGALSPGDIANAAIGRAVGLIVKNIGGARKGIEDMGVIGNPSKYSLVIGENEEESPWTPLHVDRGFRREESTLTLFFPNGFAQSVPRSTSAEGIARALADMGPWSMSCLIVIPSHARILAAEGWTKEKLQEYILRNAADPFAAIGEKPDVLSAPPALNRGGLLILVAGGPGAWMGMLRSVGGIENDFVTEPIEFPKNWDALVKKYKNVRPTYEDY